MLDLKKGPVADPEDFDDAMQDKIEWENVEVTREKTRIEEK